MRVFLAGPGSQREMLGSVIRETLPRLGCTAYDWTSCEGWTDPAQHDPVEAATRYLREVFQSDAIIWRLSRHAHSHGAPFEAGYAYALGKPVVIWGLPLPPNLIYGHLIGDDERYRSSQLERCVEIARELVARHSGQVAP